MVRVLANAKSDQPEDYDENVWEEVEVETSDDTTLRASSPTLSSHSAVRRRTTRTRTVYAVASPRRQRTPAPPPSSRKRLQAQANAVELHSPPPRQKFEPPSATTRDGAGFDEARQELVRGIVGGGVFTARYAFDVLYTALRLLRRPIELFLVLWVVVYALGRMSASIRAAFAPLCIIPGISSTSLCVHPHDGSSSGGFTVRHPDFPKLMAVQELTFDALLDSSAGGSRLALDIKKAELATADLATVVRYSDLPSREPIADALMEFTQDARRTSAGLQKLSSKVSGAVDGVTALNDYALRTIEASQSKSTSLGQVISSFSPFSFFISSFSIPSFSIPSASDIAVSDTFAQAMDLLSSEMKRLTLEAQVSLANLLALEERLRTLHTLIAREGRDLSSAHADVLSDLWTRLGGNRRRLRDFDESLHLLRNVGAYRKQALAHVVSALQTLEALGEDMEELRERVAAPALVGMKIPLEVHVKSIQMGMERLREGRETAKSMEAQAMERVLAIADGEM